MNNPDISIVIPTLGRIAILEHCLDSLLNQKFANFEVIIVTNNLKEAEFIRLKYKQLDISIIEQKEEGLAYARNLGFYNAKGKIISFIDDDVVLSLDWTKEILNTFSTSDNIGGVSGPTIIPESLINNRDILSFHSKIKRNILWGLIGKIYMRLVLENQADAIGKIFRSGAFSLGSNYKESTALPSIIEVGYLEACNMSFKKAILDKTGGFSLEYKGIGDWSEPDLAFRIKKSGYRLVFSAKAVLSHNISQQGVFKQRGKDSYQRMINFIHFYFKWIKPNTPDKALRFSLNLVFLNLYWVYKFLQTRQPDWLLGIRGTFCGLGNQLYVQEFSG